ncbi:hypothetical protein HALY111708_01850 [Halomonas lysinitropha]
MANKVLLSDKFSVRSKFAAERGVRRISSQHAMTDGQINSELIREEH